MSLSLECLCVLLRDSAFASLVNRFLCPQHHLDLDWERTCCMSWMGCAFMFSLQVSQKHMGWRCSLVGVVVQGGTNYAPGRSGNSGLGCLLCSFFSLIRWFPNCAQWRLRVPWDVPNSTHLPGSSGHHHLGLCMIQDGGTQGTRKKRLPRKRPK